jgi:Flp pilus assembly protein TadG
MSTAAGRGKGERGQVTAFVAAFMMGVFFVVALVFDGGQMIAAQRRATNLADSAARAAAQALDQDARRAGVTRLDPALADRLVRDHLAGCGCSGHLVGINGDEATVQVSVQRSTSFLGLNRSYTRTGTAEFQEGITERIE